MTLSCKSSFHTRSIRLSPVQLLILAHLKKNPSHGYMIMQGLREKLDGWSLKSGTLYPALRRLRELGLIEGTNMRRDDGPDAIKYELTEKGKKTLSEAMQGLEGELRAQESLWRFLGGVASRPQHRAMLHWCAQARSPMGFVFMRQQCEGRKCGPAHHDFLEQYREYLKHELAWVEERLSRLKGSDSHERR
ncbi:MAG: PadR family transcriptional regulator [Candidatus Thorarchaeota archaeon]